MSKNLVIVESPAKAKTIEKYLGSDFVVKSSMGHIRSLPSKNGSIDVKNKFEPIFEINPDKKKTIAELKKQAKCKVISKENPELFRPVDVTLQIPDVSKFVNKTGFVPKYCLKDSVKLLLNYYRNQ
jgi:GDP-D-mannose dehydratase